MSQSFVFVGDPGLNAVTMLETLKKEGLVPKRISIEEDIVQSLQGETPAAIVLGCNLDKMRVLVDAIRGERLYSDVPIVVRAPESDSFFLEEAFRIGVDEYFLDNNMNHFAALVAAIQKNDTWDTVRAPAGRIILGHNDRLERIKISRVLRRGGYDTYFVSSTDELEDALTKIDARAIVVSGDLPGNSVLDIIQSQKADSSPWVVTVPGDELEEFDHQVETGPTVKLFEAKSDAEGLTFSMNELLAPPPTGTRQSQRVLYGVPVSYVLEDSREKFPGFSYNISLGGLYIRSLCPLPLQTRLEATFRTPFGRGEVVATVQVVWCKELGNTSGAASPPGMGVQILSMWPADQAGFERGYQLLAEEQSEEGIRTTTAPAPVV